MIENNEQLAATLDYIAKWADTLEGMRAYEADRNPGIFPTTAAGPLNEIRKNLELARNFVRHKQAVESRATTNGTKSKQNDFATARVATTTVEL